MVARNVGERLAGQQAFVPVIRDRVCGGVQPSPSGAQAIGQLPYQIE
jgi:hypothetical protein